MKILNRYTNSVIFECEANTMKETVEMAVKQGVSLSDADLNDANLRYASLNDANLSGAYIRDANLRYANLSGADLRGANLTRANLIDADLGGADLRGADLRGANLTRANLIDADLRGANLGDAYLGDADLSYADLGGANFNGAHFSGANLSGADLRYADLSEIKADYLTVLSMAKHEVVELYKALLSGRIDGSSYAGDCACLVGTIANIRHEDYRGLGIELRPDSSRSAEKWFLNIRKGDTPENNAVSAIVKDWTLEFMENNGIVV
jgi:uncharacterized protein YjbI with pentapeptide repeats